MRHQHLERVQVAYDWMMKTQIIKKGSKDVDCVFPTED